MKQNIPRLTAQTLSNWTEECEQTHLLAQRGGVFLKQCGSCNKLTDFSEEELAEIGRNANLEKLMASPKLLKWWNVLRQ